MSFSQKDVSQHIHVLICVHVFAFTERNNKLMEDVYRFKEADSKSIANQQQLQQQLILLEKVSHKLFYTNYSYFVLDNTFLAKHWNFTYQCSISNVTHFAL